ncbi:hypothetical protein Dda_3006 [Drechslerella dactyloides]|uniref:Replicase polyprotein 1a n=1 Tax=Drechslerella dactyloides TaxID=74499 RepID=A0AAD6J4Y6_DREDA|nr:hypothetical protein Dda_3006 [Drechslerella dactyloides]
MYALRPRNRQPSRLFGGPTSFATHAADRVFLFLQTQSLWYTPSHTFGYTAPPKPSTSQALQYSQHAQNPTQHHHHHRTHREATRSALAAYGPSALQQLAIDEDAVEKRKLHIARFGATWIKPPGMMKTLQGVIDEELERAEQLALEETTADEAGLGIQEVNMVGGDPVDVVEEGEEEEGDVEVGEEEDVEEVEAEEEGLMEEGEVDLDADIPEADSTGGWSDDAEEEDDEDEEEEEDDEEDDEDEEEEDYEEVEPADEISTYEEVDEVDELSAIAETTQGSIDDSYASEVGDGSPRPITPARGQQRRHTPASSARQGQGPPIGRFQDMRRPHRAAAARSPLNRTPATPPGRGIRRGRAPAADLDSSVMFMSGDEMEVDDD